MTRRPVSALRVADLNGSIAFYCDGLGFTLEWSDPGAGVAQIARAEGLPLLLAGHGLADITPYTDPPHLIAQAGKTLYMGAPTDLREYRDILAARGLPVNPVVVEPDDSLVLTLTDPDGYRLSFWQEAVLTDEQILERYGAAPGRLQAALDGLNEAQLDLVRAPGKWSIRQTVHHLTDSDASSLVRILMALAEPGREFKSNPYSQDAWVAGLDAAHRPVGPSLALFAAIRGHVMALVQHLPGALDRSLETTAGRTTARRMLSALAGHAIGHTAQILETRKVHGI